MELTASFSGRISSSLITEREQPSCLHSAEQVSREGIQAASKTQSGHSSGNVRSFLKGFKAGLSPPAVVYMMRAEGVERGCETRY